MCNTLDLHLWILTRNSWTKATELSNTALDMKESLRKAADLASQVKSLESAFLAREHFDASKWASISGIKDALNMLTDTEANKTFTDSDSAAVSALVDAKESLLTQMPDFTTVIASIQEFCQKQWTVQSSGLMLDGFEDASNKIFLAAAYTGQARLFSLAGSTLLDGWSQTTVWFLNESRLRLD